MTFVLIRNATDAEMPAVGDVRLAAYLAGGFLTPDSGYVPTLRALGADGVGEVLVAVEPGSPGQAERIVGTVMLQPWPHAGPVATGPEEAEIRALAVDPGAQGAGVGWALVSSVVNQAAAAGVGHLVLCTQTQMRAAHRLYERAGFVRLPERDWSPHPGTILLAYGKRLGTDAESPG